MSDVDAVIELLERWRDASGMERVRIGIDATRTIGGLSADRKRALAVQVAERVAPQLVPAIESETGDLTGEQVAAVIDLLRRADREQLDDLVTALRGGDVLGALDLVDGTVDIIAPGDPRLEELLTDVTEPDLPEPADQPVPDLATHDDTDADEHQREAAAAAAAAASAAVAELADDAALDAAQVERLRQEAAAAAARSSDRWIDSSPGSSEPAYQAPAVDFGVSFDDLELPDPEVTSVAPLTDGLHEHTGTDTVERPPLTAGPVTAVAAAITATADGYRRRRAAIAAIDDGRLDRADVATVVTSFARPTDRAWVAGRALDTDLIDAADLDGLQLTPAAQRRLSRRDT